MQKRILLVGPRVQQVKTGVGVAFELLIENLKETEHRVAIVNTQWGGAVRNSGGLNIRRIFVVVVCVLQSWWKLPRSQTLYMPISTSKFGFLRDYLIIRAASLLKVRVVVHLHGGGLKLFYEKASPKLQKLIRKTLSRADCCIVLGELLKDQFSFVSNAEEKIKVVLNGTPIDESKIPPSHVKQPPKIGSPWRFLYLSNLMPTKGYLELIKACRLLVDQGVNDFHCDLCGEFLSSVVENQSLSVDDQQAEFLKTIQDPKIAGHIRYHGTVSGGEKIELLKNCHILVLPTYYPWEGQPLSINEALAWATPIVTTRHRGIPEQVIPEVNGFFVEPKSAASLAACMRKFIEGQTRYEELSDNARKHYQANFTNKKHIASLIPLLVDF